MSRRNSLSEKAARRAAREDRHERAFDLQDWRIQKGVCRYCGRYDVVVYSPALICEPCLKDYI